MGAIGPNHIGDRHTGGGGPIGENPGAVGDDTFDEAAGDVRPEARG